MFSFNDKESMKEFSEVTPKYFKPAEKPRQPGLMRVAFLTDKLELRLVYSLKDNNADSGNNFRGTFLSLTGQTGLKLGEIKTLLRQGDKQKLKADAQIIGKPPEPATIIPALKYQLDSNGRPDPELFESMAFEVGFVWISGARFRAIKSEMELMSGKGKDFQDLDFIVSTDGKELGWKFRADDDSLYGQYRKNEKLQKRIEKKLKAEYERLGVTTDKEVVDKYLGQSMSEDQWITKLTQFGYLDLEGAGDSDFKAAASVKTASKSEEKLQPVHEEKLFDDDEDDDE